MKTKSKIKKIPKKSQKVKSRHKPSASVKYCFLSHLKLIEPKHTGKLIHHRHTSHLALFIVIVLVGIFLLLNQSFVVAEPFTQPDNSPTTNSGSVSVGVIVPGPPPSIGAKITSPANGVNLSDDIINVSGTCEAETFVVIKNNDITAGSTICTSASIFNLQIQLHFGSNSLSALNYDNMNQAGPNTEVVVVYVNSSSVAATTIKTISPIIPSNPSIITGVDSNEECGNYKSSNVSTGGDPHIAVVCVPRLILPNTNHLLGVMAWGGAPPYAVSIDFKDGLPEDDSASDDDMLLSLSAPGYKAISFNYGVPNIYKIALKLTDSNGKTAIVQTAVQVSGKIATAPAATIIDDIFGSSWFQSPVPFYTLAVAITLGFWGGDIFDRQFGISNYQRQNKRVIRRS